jgi:hypothetical protein
MLFGTQFAYLERSYRNVLEKATVIGSRNPPPKRLFPLSIKLLSVITPTEPEQAP